MRRIPGESLWLGHAGDVRDLTSLHEKGVRAVVDLAWEEPPALLTRDLVVCRFPLVDGSGNPPWLLGSAIETAARFLRFDIPTLIACGAGMSRSPCIAAAAVALVRKSSAEESLALVARIGPADVSPGLWAEVRAVLESLLADE